MKRIIRLKESGLVQLINKFVNEQEHHMGSDAFEDYVYELEQIYQNAFNLGVDDMGEDALDFAEDEISRMLNHAETNVDLSDDEMEELYQMADDMMRDMNFELKNRHDMNEGTKAKKPKAMRSKKSGVKTQKTINQNHEVLRKLVKEELEMDDIEDDEEEDKEIHPALARQLRHFDPDEFTIIGKIKSVPNPPSKTPDFILRSRNKTEDGTKILGLGFGYEDKVVKLTGVTKNGKRPSFQNPLKLTKRPHVLSR